MKNKSEIYDSYFNNQYWNSIKVENYYNDYYIYTDKSIWDLFKNMDKNIKILDLWCWFWGFANFCYKNWFHNYTGIDLSSDELEIAKKNFPNYKFEHMNFFDYIESIQDNSCDIIYLSHVFEHLTLEEWSKLIKIVFNKLNKNGLFINYQPNADSYFHWTSWIYVDITHERLYNIDSYRQLIKTEIWKSFNLSFRNSYIWKNFIFNIIHKITKSFFEFFLLLMWYDKKPIYTMSFYSILRKL